MDAPRGTVYEFGAFALDQRRFELRHAGKLVRIERLAHDFLAYLILRRDRVVSIEELLAQLWPGVVVTRSAVARVVLRARSALGDDASSPSWIATLRGRGYRFVGTVREHPDIGAAATAEPAHSGWTPSAPTERAQAVAPDPFVGRTRELGHLLQALELARLAHENAAAHYMRAIELLGSSGSKAFRCELLIGLGEAQMSSGDPEVATHVSWQAARLAR